MLHPVFALTGVLHVVGGAVLPSLAARLHLSDSASGLLFLLYFAGTSIGALLCRGSYARLMTIGFAAPWYVPASPCRVSALPSRARVPAPRHQRRRTHVCRHSLYRPQLPRAPRTVAHVPEFQLERGRLGGSAYRCAYSRAPRLPHRVFALRSSIRDRRIGMRSHRARHA